jgi:hypothetical protein
MKNGNVGIGTSTTNPHSNLQTFGSFAAPYRLTSFSITASATDYTITVDAPLTRTISLPTAVGITGRIYVIKSRSSNTVIIDPSGSETIDGSTTINLTASTGANSVAIIQSDGTNWIRLN